jgi:hypothetical protein
MLRPTNKWWTATIVAAGTIVLTLINGDGINSDGERTLVVGLIVQRLVAYATRNDPSEEERLIAYPARPPAPPPPPPM